MYPIKHISVSSINQLETCAWCWVHQYIRGNTPPEYQPFIDGKLRHKEVDKYHTGKPYDKEVIHTYVENYPQDYRLKSEVKVHTYLKYKNWTSKLPILAFVDGTRDKELVDLKYAKAKPQSKRNLQGIVYSWFFYMKYKEFPMFTWNWWNKGNDKIQNVSTTYSESDIEWAMDKIDWFTSVIQKPHFLIEAVPGKPFMPFHFEECPCGKPKQ